MSSSHPMTPEPGLPATIGRYTILRLIGEGAMGRVLLAHDPVLGRDVAVKHLRTDLKIPRDVRQGLLTRMRHEARAAARVAHPNLVTLHDMGEDPEVALFLVFEYVEGPTLKQRIAEGPMPPREVAELARQLGDALTIAHDAGILHRDVKPENVIVSRSGGKIADFGIARIPDSTLTHQGGLMGTPAYSAPETFRAGKFSPASDQFSLGASLYEALSGKRAFPGDDAVSVASKIAHDAPDPVAAALGLSPAVDATFARALAKKPEERFATCAEFGDVLAKSLAADPAARTPSPLTTPAPIPSLILPSAESAAAQPSLQTDWPRETSSGRARLPSDPPTERRSGQVILGAAVVVATAALLVRTALHSGDAADTEPPAPSAIPAASASASAPKPRVTPPLKQVARPRVEPTTAASAMPASTTEPRVDAGAPDAGPAPSPSTSTTAAPATTGSKNDAPPP